MFKKCRAKVNKELCFWVRDMGRSHDPNGDHTEHQTLSPCEEDSRKGSSEQKAPATYCRGRMPYRFRKRVGVRNIKIPRRAASANEAPAATFLADKRIDRGERTSPKASLQSE